MSFARPENLRDDEHKESKMFISMGKQAMVYKTRVTSDLTAKRTKLLIFKLPSSSKASTDVALAQGTSGRRQTQKKRTDEVTDFIFTLKYVLQKALCKGYKNFKETKEQILWQISQSKLIDDPLDTSYKDALDVEKFFKKLGDHPELKNYFGTCCMYLQCSESRAISCKAVGCPSLIERDNVFWEVDGLDENITICGPCFKSKQSDSVKVKQKMITSPVYAQTEWIEVSRKKTEFKKGELQGHAVPELTVECVFCHHFHHSICVMYDQYNWSAAYEKYCPNFSKNFWPVYVCTNCMRLRLHLDKSEIQIPSVIPFHPKALKETKLSRELEEYIKQALGEITDDTGRACYANDKYLVREVSLRRGIYTAKPHMMQEFKNNGDPYEWEYIQRSILLMQQKPESEYPVAVFNMIVYEYPSTKMVNLSYIDSVKLLDPPFIRRGIYQNMVTCYLDYVRQRGYQYLQFWVCPPLGGDEYVFYGRPNEPIKDPPPGQENGVMKWYKEVLDNAKSAGIVKEYKQLGPGNIPFKDYRKIPYLKDEFFPQKLESIIEEYKAETEAYNTFQTKEADGRNKSRSSKKIQNRGPPASIQSRVEELIRTQCQNNILCVDLYAPNENENTFPAIVEDETVDIYCPYMSNRDYFMVNCREYKYDFSNKRRARYATLALFSRVAKEARSIKCTTCAGTISKGIYCYKCLNNNIFCNICVASHEHNATLRRFVVHFRDLKIDFPIIPIILKQLYAEGEHLTNMGYQICHGMKRRYPEDPEFADKVETLVYHMDALHDRDHQDDQIKCKACQAAWLPLIRHRQFCKGKVCNVPSCTLAPLHSNEGVSTSPPSPPHPPAKRRRRLSV